MRRTTTAGLVAGLAACTVLGLTGCGSTSSSSSASGSASSAGASGSAGASASASNAALTVPVRPSPTGACTLPEAANVTDLTFAQLAQYQLKNGEPIPTLAEFLNYANDVGVGVLPEIKTFPPAADQPKPVPTQAQFQQYSDMVRSRTNISEVLIGSFDETTLKYFADNDPSWPRVWFRGVGNGDAFAPPTVAEMQQRAPSANALGVLNILYVQGTFAPNQQPYDVPKEFADAQIPVYIWYNVATKGDTPENGPDLAGVTSPGWQAIASMTPKNVKWIATDMTKEYTAWAATATEAEKPIPQMVAHRGGGEADISENSMAAFKEAVANGAKVLETDVQWTKPTPEEPNGVPVLMHDATINRTSVCPT